MKRVAVYCGARAGARPEYAQAAYALGLLLAREGIGVVYGGAAHGLMGALGDGVVAGGGELVGVIPRGLWRREFPHSSLSAQHLVDSMHERKALMASLADGFVALPGGFGTLDEWFEVLTWLQVGIHHKPIGLLDTLGYFAPLLQFLKHACDEGFVAPALKTAFVRAEAPDALLLSLRQHSPPVSVVRWGA